MLERFLWHRWQAAGLEIVIGNGRAGHGSTPHPRKCLILSTANQSFTGPFSRLSWQARRLLTDSAVDRT